MVCVSGMGTGGPRVQYRLQYNTKNLSWANSVGGPLSAGAGYDIWLLRAVNLLAFEVAASEKQPAFKELHTFSQYNFRIF